MTAAVQVIRPHILGAANVAKFARAVAAGGEVSTDSLQERVKRAAYLAVLTVDGKPVGVGALKIPTDGHRDSVTCGSGVDVSESEYKYELGWVVVMPEYRGRKLSRMIVDALLARVGDAGVFCTVRGDNLAVQAACAGYGFVEAGTRWQGTRGMLGLGIWQRTGVGVG